MTTQITHPRPIGPYTLRSHTSATDTLASAASDQRLDALPLLGHRTREQTLPPRIALRGTYLALSDGSETRLLRLDRDITHLGRSITADIRLDEHRVSRDHAILVRHGRHFRLLDNRSSNGTFVNGRRVSATTVSSGDVIDLGPVRLQLVEVE